jgi:hypothetical protein
LIAKSGPFTSNQLALDLQFANVTIPRYYRGEINTTGTPIGTTAGFARIIVIVDDDCSRIQWIEGSFQIGAPVSFNFSVADLFVCEAAHNPTFSVVDSDGEVAPPIILNVTVIPPTRTASASPRPSSSPTRFMTQTPALSNVSLSVWLAHDSFDIYGNDRLIGTSYRSFSALLRMNESEAVVQGDIHAVISGVTFSFHSTLININAALLTFHLANVGDSARTASVGVSTGMWFDGFDGVAISEIEPRRKFIVSSPSNACAFLLRG